MAVNSNNSVTTATSCTKRQHARGREIEPVEGGPLDGDLERGVALAAEHEHDTERREREEEHDRRRRRDGGAEQWPRDLAQRLPPRRAQGASGLIERRVEVRPQAADRSHDDRVVEERVRQQDRPDRSVEVDDAGEHAPRPDEAEEGRGDDDRRQHERHRDRRSQQRLAGEAKAGDHVRAGERERQRERGRGRRLPHREPHDATRTRVAQHIADDAEIPATVRSQAAGHDVTDGPREEDREEGERDADEPRRRQPTRQPRTADVQSLIHCSRF